VNALRPAPPKLEFSWPPGLYCATGEEAVGIAW
jgi:hypothetical protein